MFTEAALDAEANQGTAVFLLDARGHHDVADLLEIATLTYSSTNYDDCVNADLGVDVALLDSYNEDVCGRVEEALNDVLRAAPDYVSYVRAYPRPICGDWREARRQGRLTGINNQGTKLALPPGHPRKHGLNFRDSAEVRVFEGLERLQQELPVENTVLVAANAVVFVAGKTREIDFVVTYRNRAGIIEVDGDTHRNRYAADQSRDRCLRDGGVDLIERIVAEDTNDPLQVDTFLRKFIDRLIAR